MDQVQILISSLILKESDAVQQFWSLPESDLFQSLHPFKKTDTIRAVLISSMGWHKGNQLLEIGHVLHMIKWKIIVCDWAYKFFGCIVCFK